MPRSEVAGVRKPPRKEREGIGGQSGVGYGDLRAAGEVYDWDGLDPSKLADGEPADEWVADGVGHCELSDDLRRHLKI